jgi:hypothetical protein
VKTLPLGSHPAFPRPASVDTSSGTLPDGDAVVGEQAGMTYRDWLVGKAMEGYLASWACKEDSPTPDDAAAWAVRYADAVLARLADGK